MVNQQLCFNVYTLTFNNSSYWRWPTVCISKLSILHGFHTLVIISWTEQQRRCFLGMYKVQMCYFSNRWILLHMHTQSMLNNVTHSNLIKLFICYAVHLPFRTDFDIDILFTHAITVDKHCILHVKYITRLMLTVCGGTNNVRHLQQK